MGQDCGAQGSGEKYKPGNLSELISDVKDAAKKGLKLRAVGSGHAWSNLGVPARRRGAVIEMKRLKKVLGLKGNVVEVEGGITVENLNKWLFKRNLALENMGDANPQNIAGRSRLRPMVPGSTWDRSPNLSRA